MNTTKAGRRLEAHLPGEIPLRIENLGQCIHMLERREMFLQQPILPILMRMQSRIQCTARATTTGGACESEVKFGAFRSESVDVGGNDAFATVTTEVFAQVVSDHQQDVLVAASRRHRCR